MQGWNVPERAWCACFAALVALAPVPSLAKTSATTDPCRVVRSNDIFRLLGWTVEHVRARPYHFGSLSGKLCNYESSQGIVTTILPDPGLPFPGVTAENTPDSGDLVQTLPGYGALVQIFNGAVYVTRDRRRVAVRVVPESHPASDADVEPFAKVIVSRFR